MDDFTVEDLDLVQKKLGPLLRHVPPSECRDCFQAGCIALWNLKRRHDPSQGKLSTYSEYRIRGAAKDWLRKVDHLGRVQRGKVNEDEAMDPRIDLDPDLCESPAAGPLEALERADAITKIYGAVDSLSARDASIFREYYIKGTPMLELGEQYRITESRVCQILAQARKFIKRRLRAHEW